MLTTFDANPGAATELMKSSTCENVRVLVVDDYPAVRFGLRQIIASEPGMEIAGEARDGVEAVQQAHNLCPDVIVMDLVMPRKGGLDAINEIRRDNPAARILVLTGFGEQERIDAALQAGAVDCLSKYASPEILLQALRDVSGRPSFGESVSQEIAPS